MQKNIERKVLLNPGPATTSEGVKLAQIVPDICPREREFGEIANNVRKELAGICDRNDEYSCVLFTGSGTAAMDSVLSSVVHNKKILIINNGYYGERFLQIAKAYQIPHEELKVDMLGEVDVLEVEQILEKRKDIGYVAMVHHETTTGILNPTREIGELCKRNEKIFIVDAVASFAGIPFSAKEHNIDYLFSTSNKCLQAMPGICFVIGKKEGIESLKDKPKRNYYLDLYEQYKFFEKTETGQGTGGGQSRFTPAVQVIYTMAEALNELREEGGVEKRYKRYSESYEVLLEGLEKLGFRPTHRREIHSKISTTVFEPEGKDIDFKELHDKLYEKGYIIYPNRVEYHGNPIKVIRFANMGDINREDISGFLSELNRIIKKCEQLY